MKTYFQREQMHRTAPWDSCRTAACRYTLWIYRSGANREKSTQHRQLSPVRCVQFFSEGIFTQTSGWNCCSVLVWQYWHPSAPSHLLGSPHSSLCFTAGQGNALRCHGRTAPFVKHIHNYTVATDICKSLLQDVREHLYLCLCGLRLRSLLLW